MAHEAIVSSGSEPPPMAERAGTAVTRPDATWLASVRRTPLGAHVDCLVGQLQRDIIVHHDRAHDLFDDLIRPRQ